MIGRMGMSGPGVARSQADREWAGVDIWVRRGTRSRISATQRLREYVAKGSALGDERLKRRGTGNYFEELVARIRDIRPSEKVFWCNVLDIYATSIDYDPKAHASERFYCA